MDDVVIVSGARTAIGTFGGSFKDVPAPKLGATAIKAALERAGVSPEMVDDVIMGCAGQIGEDAYLARTCALGAGIPKEVPAFTVNRLCGSGLQAINSGAMEIMSGNAEIVVAGGAEAMSRFPYLVRGARWGMRMGAGEMEDGLITALNCPVNHYHMGVTAENVAELMSISRQEQDEYSYESQRRAVAAIQAGKFKSQIIPLTVSLGRGQTKDVDTDEHPRADTTLERMAKLAPAFKPGGTVTAGNASGINDAGAAVVLMSASKAKELGLKPKLKLVSQAVAGVDPATMGLGPGYSTPKALKKAGLTIDQIDMIEANEAFAAQVIGAGKMIGWDWNRVNPNGGAVALGHPVGATGAILTIKLMNQMAEAGGKYGLVTLCIGGGQGITTIYENMQ